MGACGSRRQAKEEEEEEEKDAPDFVVSFVGNLAPVEYDGTSPRSRRKEAERLERAREEKASRVARSARKVEEVRGGAKHSQKVEEVRGGAKHSRRDEPQKEKVAPVSLVRTPPRQEEATPASKRSFGGRKLFGMSATKESQSLTSLKKKRGGAVATTPPEAALSPGEKARIEAQISELWATTAEKKKPPPSIATEADIDVAVECGVSVVIRARPSEKQAGKPCVTINGAVLTVRDSEPPNNSTSTNRNNRTFGPFDAVLPAGATQEATYRAVASPIVAKVLRGFNGCVIAYGATGSGKTHSIVGTTEHPGVIDRALNDLFSTVDAERATVETSCCCTYVELYLETIGDLLTEVDNEVENDPNNKSGTPVDQPRRPSLGDKPRQPLTATNNGKKKAPPAIREEKGGRGVFLENVTRRRCDSVLDAKRALREGSRRRTVRGTALNDKSSRSHAIFTLEFERRDANDECAPIVRAKFHLVDLAGSERIGETMVVDKGLKESCSINSSLSVLGKVVSTLSDMDPTKHVSYRDSKLTRLLQDSLGGNSYTTMLCCVSTSSAAKAEEQHTISTLRFAARAKNIVLKPHINIDPRDAEIARLRQQNSKLRKQLADAMAIIQQRGQNV